MSLRANIFLKSWRNLITCFLVLLSSILNALGADIDSSVTVLFVFVFEFLRRFLCLLFLISSLVNFRLRTLDNWINHHRVCFDNLFKETASY